MMKPVAHVYLYRDLEISVEELQSDVKTKRCYVTINDVESFALVLSTISRALVDLKGKHSNRMNEFLSLIIFSHSIVSWITR